MRSRTIECGGSVGWWVWRSKIRKRRTVTRSSFRALRDLGWIVGRNLHIDYRYTIGDDRPFAAQAAELIALAPDVLLANNTPATRALQQATSTIPIVFALVLDPVASGVVTNLAQSGGNVGNYS